MRTSNPTGFTLIEALIALAITALLVGVAVPAWSSASESASVATRLRTIRP